MSSDAARPPVEPRVNEPLRAVDWRFLLRMHDRPRAVVLNAPRQVAEGLELIAERATAGPGEADLAVLGFPSRRSLRRARAGLKPGGQVVCLWRRPRIAGVQRAGRRLRRAGFEPTSFHWPGPNPNRPPEYWLPLGAPEVIDYFLAQRPPGTRTQLAMRRLWRLAERSGALAPICALARLPGPPASEPGEIDALPAAGPALLLTEGDEARHKVLCLSFSGAAPVVAVKCARIPATDQSLDREAEVLTELAQMRPRFELAPRVLAKGRRAGRRAVAESVAPGRLPPEPLSQATFARLAPRVVAGLLELVDERPAPASSWRQRLAEEPLARFERRFAQQVGPSTIASARDALAKLPDLPLAWEHRDCAVWNIHVADSGAISFFDWGGSEPRGLPGLDLAYFLATSAFMIDRLDMRDPRTVVESHRRLLDPSTPRGELASRCAAEYCERLRIDPALFPLLRLRGWIVKADPADPAAASFAALAAAEIPGLRELG